MRGCLVVQNGGRCSKCEENEGKLTFLSLLKHKKPKVLMPGARYIISVLHYDRFCDID